MDDKPSVPPPSGSKPGAQPPPRFATFSVLLMGIILVVMAVMYFAGDGTKSTEINYGVFRKQLDEENVKGIKLDGSILRGQFKDMGKAPAEGTNPKLPVLRDFYTVVPHLADSTLDELLLKHAGKDYRAERLNDGTSTLMMFYLGISLLLLVGFWLMYRRARDQFMGGGILSGFSKSPAKRY